MPPLSNPPGRVMRHVASLLPSSGISAFTSSSLTSLIPKPPKTTHDGMVASPGQFANLFITDRFKPNVMSADLSETEAGKRCLIAEGGANFRVTDIAPRTKGLMHATDSLDFLIFHKGQVTLHLDSGEKRQIKEGDVIVQCGTAHAWENETDEWARMYVVLLHTDRPACAHKAIPTND